MSINAMNMVFDAEGLDAREKLIMLILADYSDAEGWSFPGRGKLVRRSGFSESTVYRIVKKLEEQGFVAQVRRADANGHRTSNGYQLFPDRLAVNLTGRPTGQNGGSYRSTVTGTEEPSDRTTRRKKESAREIPLPDDWKPTEDHRERAKTSGLDVEREAELFRLHAETHGRMAKQWNSAFTTWLIKAADKPVNVTAIRPNLRVVEPAPEYPDQDELRRRREAAIEKTKAAAADPKFLTDYGLTPEEVERNRRRMEGLRARRREEES